MLTNPTIFYYPGYSNKPRKSRCNLWVNKSLHFALVEERSDNKGASVTNAVEQLADMVSREYDLDPQKLIWVEVYHIGTKDEYYSMAKLRHDPRNRQYPFRLAEWVFCRKEDIYYLLEGFFEETEA